MTTYRCEPCAEIVFNPNWADASEPVYDADTGFKMIRTHLPTCPHCQRVVRPVAPTTAELLDIMRIPS